MKQPLRSVWIGWDSREADAYAVAHYTTRQRYSDPLPRIGAVGPLYELRKSGLYTRPTEKRDGRLWDVISDAPMSTEFAIARFLTPACAGAGLALFMDADVLVRADLAELFASVDATKAVSVVKHDHRPLNATKMDGQVQTSYRRKNWSSVMVFNCEHPKVEALTVERVNAMTGRELHQFAWLDDDDIGELHPKWNWLVGHSDPAIEPGVVHFTDGYPQMAGYENVAYADEWRAALEMAEGADALLAAT